MPKITVAGPDGKPFETDLPEGFVPQSTLERDFVPRATHESFTRKMKDQVRDELLKDQGFRGDALKAWGLEAEPAAGAEGAGKGKKGEPDADLVNRIRQDFTEKELTPVMQERDALAAQVEDARQLIMERAVVDAALSIGVDPELCKGSNGDQPEIAKLLAGAVAYDPETGRCFACDIANDSFRISTKRRNENESPYMTIPELIEEWGKTHPRYLVSTKQRGAGFGGAATGGAGGGGGSRILHAPDARTFGANLEDIAAGRTKVVLPGVEE